MSFVVQQGVDTGAGVSFPIVLPSSPTPSITTLHGISASAVTVSPYDGSQQVQGSPAGLLLFEVDYPPMTRDEAEDVIGALLSLNGQLGTFMLGDDIGFAPRGLLSVRYNLLRYSEALDNAIWMKEGSGVAAPTVTANAVNDDLAALIAEQIDFPSTSAGQYSRLRQDLPYQCGAGQTVTFSIWLRASVAGPHAIEIKFADLPFAFSFAVNAAVTNTWQRFSVTATFPAAAVNPGMSVYISQIASQSAWTIYACKAQLEYAAAASTYQSATQGPAAVGAWEGEGEIEIYGLGVGIRYLRTGDWIGVGKHLHKVTRDSTSDATTGHFMAQIFPTLREDVSADAPIYWLGARGEFRRTDDDLPWSIDQVSLYGLKFTAQEAF